MKYYLSISPENAVLKIPNIQVGFNIRLVGSDFYQYKIFDLYLSISNKETFIIEYDNNEYRTKYCANISFLCDDFINWLSDKSISENFDFVVTIFNYEFILILQKYFKNDCFEINDNELMYMKLMV